MKVRVLFVCMGNICRSPTAQGVFEHLVEAQGLADVIGIDSAGTHAYHVGEGPDERASPYDRSGFPADGMAPAEDSAELHSQFRPAPRKRKPTYKELQADSLREQPMPGPVMPYPSMPIPPGPSYHRAWPAW